MEKLGIQKKTKVKFFRRKSYSLINEFILLPFEIFALKIKTKKKDSRSFFQFEHKMTLILPCFIQAFTLFCV